MPRRGQLVVVANRLPVHRVSRGGRARWEESPGGLVSALTPILRDREGTWVGWAGQAGSAPEPFEHDGIALRPVGLSRAEVTNFYEGFSNQTLWPLYHDVVRRPEFHRHWWRPYVEVNRRYAEVVAEGAARNAAVWVHDYQLQLVPRFLRALRPDVRIGFFLHIPFPPLELCAQLPWRRELVEGLLGADLTGFQTRDDARNFRNAARRFCGARVSEDAVRSDDRATRARAFPISIDVQRYEALAQAPETAARVAALRRRLGEGRRILLGVDRLDYTKGIDLRLKAFGELLESGRVATDEAVFVQVAVPSRERVPEYAETRDRVEGLVGNINGRFGQVGHAAVHYLRRNLPAEELVALYRAADVMVVTPLRDGMNLVAKEYVAARTDDAGVLVLSEFAGAAHELSAALLVNPHDLDGMNDAFERALRMPAPEAARRMRALREVVESDDVHHWARRFLEDLCA